jgi:hypothetical protein
MVAEKGARNLVLKGLYIKNKDDSEKSFKKSVC